MMNEVILQDEATTVHAVGAVVCYLGAKYHKRRGQRILAGLSFVMMIYHGISAVEHHMDMRKAEKQWRELSGEKKG